MDDAKETTKVDPIREPTAATQGTDLHKSKISPDDPRLHIDRPRSRTLRKGAVLAALLAIGGVVAVALVVALAGPSSDQATAKKDRADPDVSISNEVSLPDVIKEAPATYEVPAKTIPGRTDANAPTVSGVADQRVEAARQAKQEELLRARGAGVFSGVDDVPVIAQQGQPDGARRGDGSREAEGSGVAGRGAAAADPSRPPDPNLQERKNDFLSRAGVSSAEYLDKGLSLPRSPFEVKAGTVIPTVLISGINSDLPGQIVAQVRENVYASGLTGSTA